MKTSMSEYKWKLRVSYTDGTKKSAPFKTKKSAQAAYNELEKLDYVKSCEIIKY